MVSDYKDIMKSSIEVKPDLSSPKELRHFTRSQLMSWGISGVEVDDVLFALGEAASNAIKHGGLGAEEIIRLTLCLDGNRLSVTIVDNGKGFDLNALQDVEPNLNGGAGIYLIRHIASEVQIDTAPGKGTSVVMAFEVSRQGENAERQEEYFAMGLFGDKIRLVSLREDGRYRFLDQAQQLHNILYIVSSETVALEEATEELEDLINQPDIPEEEFQAFFSRNPDFLLSDEHKYAHPHAMLAREHLGPLIPDFVLEPFNQGGLCDILELKLPTERLYILEKNRPRLARAVARAVAQIREYSAYFDDRANREAFQLDYGLRAYKPRLFVVIGRRANTDQLVERKIAVAEHSDVCLKTYDEIIERMKRRLDAMKNKRGGACF